MEDRLPTSAHVEENETAESKAGAVDSVTLARLLEEVRNSDEATSPTAYNRLHNRHNRS